MSRRRRRPRAFVGYYGRDEKLAVRTHDAVKQAIMGNLGMASGIMLGAAMSWVLAELALQREIEHHQEGLRELIAAQNRLPMSWVELVPYAPAVDPPLYFYDFDAWRHGESDWWGPHAL